MNLKAESKNVAIITVAVIVVIGALLGLLIYKGDLKATTVTTTGSSETKIMPDLAVVYLNIQSINTSAQDAKDEVNTVTDNVMTALVKLGLSRDDIETEQFSIYPNYDWNNGQKITGYTATQSLKISITDFQNVGKYVDAGVNNGALVSYINFELSQKEQNKLKAQQLAEATQDARAKADAIAEGLGKKVSGVESVQTNDYNYIPYPLYRAEAGTSVKEATTDITPQKIDLTAQVSVTFKIS